MEPRYMAEQDKAIQLYFDTSCSVVSIQRSPSGVATIVVSRNPEALTHRIPLTRDLLSRCQPSQVCAIALNVHQVDRMREEKASAVALNIQDVFTTDNFMRLRDKIVAELDDRMRDLIAQ